MNKLFESIIKAAFARPINTYSYTRYHRQFYMPVCIYLDANFVIFFK